jgi:hypothetical protein
MNLNARPTFFASLPKVSQYFVTICRYYCLF